MPVTSVEETPPWRYSASVTFRDKACVPKVNDPWPVFPGFLVMNHKIERNEHGEVVFHYELVRTPDDPQPDAVVE
jgi:hypothetical protein